QALRSNRSCAGLQRQSRSRRHGGQFHQNGLWWKNHRGCAGETGSGPSRTAGQGQRSCVRGFRSRHRERTEWGRETSVGASWRMLRGTLMLGATWIVAMASWSQNASDLPKVELIAGDVQPRPIEDLTQKSITRDYAYAWKTLTMALDQNRPDLLDSYFTGL